MTTLTEPTPMTETTTDLQSLAVCFSLTLGRFSINRRVQSEQVEVDADKDRIGVKKQIINSDAYRAIQRLDGDIRALINQQALPSLLRRGIHLVPIKKLTTIEESMEIFRIERQGLIEEFLREYEEVKEEARQSLRALFDENDYPSLERIKNTFYMNYRIFSAEVPSALADLSMLAYEREKERARKFWEDSAHLIEETLRKEFTGLVDHLVERLDSDPNGKPKIFKNTLITKFDEWVTFFESRNLTNDQELDNQVQKARSLLKGVSPDDLRTAKTTRAKIRDSFAQIKKSTAEWVITKPTRMLDLD